MPKSRVRKKPPAARPPRTEEPTAPLSVAVLALVEASFALVQEVEVLARGRMRAGEGTEHEAEIHHYLRTGALGILTAYSRLEGLPDPRGLDYQKETT